MARRPPPSTAAAPLARSPCPIACTLDLLGDRWTLIVVRDLLFFGKHRFADLLASGEGIATNVLAERLTRLEAGGLVERRAYQVNPPRHEYHLTGRGHDLRPVLLALVAWGNHHLPGTYRPLEGLVAPGGTADAAASTSHPDQPPPRAARKGEATMGQPVVHFEINAKDAKKLNAFYSQLFGWRIDADNPMGYGMVDRDANLNAQGVGIGGGIGTAPEGYAGHVTFYVEVPDVEAALASAERLGGTRMMGPDKVMEGVEIGLFNDPEGNVIGLIKAQP